MSELLDNREQARSLRRRLNDHSIDIELLAAEAATVFSSAGLRVQEQWLGLELHGYRASAEPSSVDGVLGLKSGDRLVVQVKMYRVQGGTLAGPMTGVTFHHFFVEPVRALVEAQQRARMIAGRGAATMRLDFPPNRSKPYLPTSGEFRLDTFDRILLGLRAVLHLQLGSLAQ